MRYIAWVAEPEVTAPVLELIRNHWETIGVMWGFKILCVNPNGPGKYKRWPDIAAAFPQAKFIFPVAEGGTPLDKFKEPSGDVVYVVGGDYSASNNYQGEFYEGVTVDTALRPGVGTWSFLAMAVIAHKVYVSGGAS